MGIHEQSGHHRQEAEDVFACAEGIYRSLVLPDQAITQSETSLDSEKINAFTTLVDHFHEDDSTRRGLGQKIVENLRYISAHDFREVVAGPMSRAINDFVADNDYYVLFPVGSSGQRLFPSLQLARSPQELIAYYDNQALDTLIKTEQGDSATKLVIVDDAVYSGGNVNLLKSVLQRGIPHCSERLLLATVAATKRGVRRLMGEDNPLQHFFSHYKISAVGEIFSAQEIALMMDIDARQGLENFVLTFFHDRIPDNFLQMACQPIRRRWKENSPEVMLIDRHKWNERGKRGILYPDGRDGISIP